MIFPENQGKAKKRRANRRTSSAQATTQEGYWLSGQQASRQRFRFSTSHVFLRSAHGGAHSPMLVQWRSSLSSFHHAGADYFACRWGCKRPKIGICNAVKPFIMLQFWTRLMGKFMLVIYCSGMNPRPAPPGYLPETTIYLLSYQILTSCSCSYFRAVKTKLSLPGYCSQ